MRSEEKKIGRRKEENRREEEVRDKGRERESRKSSGSAMVETA